MSAWGISLVSNHVVLTCGISCVKRDHCTALRAVQHPGMTLTSGVSSEIGHCIADSKRGCVYIA